MHFSEQDEIFLLSADRPLPERFFAGHCFVGADLIIGAAGHDAWCAAHPGAALAPGEDGCYAVLARQGAGGRLGTDYKGFCHLYYYAEGTDWAVSNSFTRLLDHLRARGRSPSVNPAALAAYRAAPDIVRSLMSYETPARGIRLLPSFHALDIGPEGLREVPVPVTLGQPDYATALARFLGTWRGRLAGMLADPRLSFDAHVTGGRDSRTVFAMVRSAELALGQQAQPVRYTSQTNRGEDFAVATQIAMASGVRLNGPHPGRSDPVRRLRSTEAVAKWRAKFLGVYTHIMFPFLGACTTRGLLAGVGGEAHRQAYGDAIMGLPIDGVADRLAPKFRDPEHFADWKRSLDEADTILRGHPQAHDLAMVRSHREFRDRYHSGKNSFWGLACLILTSRLLEPCSNALAPDRFSAGQILYDIMANTMPELLYLNFETPLKSPDGAAVAHIPRLDWDRAAPPGQVYMTPYAEPGPTGIDPDQPALLELVLDKARRIETTPGAYELLGRPFCRRTLTELEAVATGPQQNLHHRGRATHLLCLTAEML